MTVLAILMQQPDVTEYVEPYDTISTIAALVLMFIYLAGVPATVAVSAVLWPQRTRQAPVAPPAAARPAPAPPTLPALNPPLAAVPVSPPAPHPAAPPTQYAGALSRSATGSAPEGLLHLQRLEREVLALPEQRPVPAATSARLAAEIEQLAARSGEGSMVHRHAARLRLIVAALAPLDAAGVPPGEPPDPPQVVYGGVPDEVRVGLGRIAATGQPIPPRWAYSWQGHRADRWPASADRRRDLLARAFARHYLATYSHGGMILALTGGKLTLRYTPASARFGGQPVDIATDLPDVADLPDAVRRLRTVTDAALRDLPPVTR